MLIKKASLLWNVGFVFALVALEAGCQRTETPAAESTGPAPSTAPNTAQSGQNPSAEVAAPAAKKPAPAVAKATPPAPIRKSVPLAAGTRLKVRTTTAISTESQVSGDTFVASLEEPLAKGGWVIAPKGAGEEGKIVAADKGGRVKGTASLEIALDRIETADGQSVRISTKSLTVEAKQTKGKDAAKVAIGAGLGAVVGAIAGGKKGAAIGAGSGAGAGTAVVLSTRGDAAEIGSETPLSFALSSPLTVSEKR